MSDVRDCTPEVSVFLPNFDHKTRNGGRVIRSRDVILDMIVQFTELVILEKVFLIFGVMAKSPRLC